MSDQTNENQTLEPTPTPPRRTHWAGIVNFILTLVILGLIAFLVKYGYEELMKVNKTLTQITSDTKDQLSKSKTDISGIDQTVSELKQAAQKSQELSAKQEQMIADWQAAQKGNLNNWYVAEAQYLVKLANNNLQFESDVNMAQMLLQRADEALGNLQDANLLEIRKSITTDIANLQALPKVDVTALYLRLNAINNQIEQLPLPVNPMQQNKQETNSTTPTANASWWQTGIDRTWDMLRKVVIVRNTNTNTLPLVLPDEKTFLFQNLHAQLEGAMWAVLHHNPAVYQANLSRASAWIKQYFDVNAPATKSMLVSLEELQKENLQPSTINMNNTLQLFDAYFKQIAKQQ